MFESRESDLIRYCLQHLMTNEQILEWARQERVKIGRQRRKADLVWVWLL